MVNRIFLLRHGERSDLAPIARKLEYPIPHDPPLTWLGHLEAEAAAVYMASTLLPSFSSIKLVSSPMLRCVQTLSKLAKIINAPIYLQAGYGESFQEAIDSPLDDLHIDKFRDLFPIDAEVIKEEYVLIPKTPESIDEASERMKKVCEEYLPRVNCEALVICTHLYPIWGFLKAIGNEYDEQNGNFTQITEIEIVNGVYKAIRVGEYKHLEAVYANNLPSN